MGIKGTLVTCPYSGMFTTVFVPDGMKIEWILEHRFESSPPGPDKCIGYKIVDKLPHYKRDENSEPTNL